MNVNRDLLWIVLGVVLLGVAGFWGYSRFGEGGLNTKIADLRQQCNAKRNELKKKADGKKDIRNPGHVEAAKEFGKELDNQKAEMLKVLDSELDGFRLPKDYADKMGLAQAQDAKGFSDWLAARRSEVREKTKEAGLALPPDFWKTFFHENQEIPGTAAAIQERLEFSALAEEILNLCLSVDAQVNVLEYVAPDPNSDRTPPPRATTKSEKLKRLDALKISTPAEWEAFRKEADEAALNQAGFASAKAQYSLPFKGQLVEMTITGALPVGMRLLDRIENHEAWYGQILRLDLQRAARPYVMREQLVDITPKGLAEKDPAVNSFYREGPVQIKVLWEILSFEKPAPPPEAGPGKQNAGPRR